MKYFDEAKRIWKSFVPKSGQSETVQGELLRAVEKLRDEAERNGNMNWDEGFEIFLNYLKSHLTDRKVFSEESIKETEQILARLSDYDDPYLDDDLYDKLSDKVVEYFKFYGSQPHKENPNLYR
jgi:hypothetical protein